MTRRNYLPVCLPLDPGEVEALDDLLLAAVHDHNLPAVLLPVAIRVHNLTASR